MLSAIPQVSVQLVCATTCRVRTYVRIQHKLLWSCEGSPRERYLGPSVLTFSTTMMFSIRALHAICCCDLSSHMCQTRIHSQISITQPHNHCPTPQILCVHQPPEMHLRCVMVKLTKNSLLAACGLNSLEYTSTTEGHVGHVPGPPMRQAQAPQPSSRERSSFRGARSFTRCGSLQRLVGRGRRQRGCSDWMESDVKKINRFQSKRK